MILISHRGNLDGKNEHLENSIDYVQKTINLGYDVEIDIWRDNGKLFLGHDKPQYPVELSWLQDWKSFLWIHTKNFEALNTLIEKDLRIFYHTNEEQTIINNCNLIWSHNLNKIGLKSIIPLLDLESIKYYNLYKDVS